MFGIHGLELWIIIFIAICVFIGYCIKQFFNGLNNK